MAESTSSRDSARKASTMRRRKIVTDGKAPAAIRGEAQKEGIEEAVVAIADVDPLGDEEQKTGRVGMGGIERGEKPLRRGPASLSPVEIRRS